MEITEVKEKIIGLSLAKAKKIYEPIRAIIIDGKPSIVTQDYNLSRINVEVKKGKITSVVKMG